MTDSKYTMVDAEAMEAVNNSLKKAQETNEALTQEVTALKAEAALSPVQRKKAAYAELASGAFGKHESTQGDSLTKAYEKRAQDRAAFRAVVDANK